MGGGRSDQLSDSFDADVSMAGVGRNESMGLGTVGGKRKKVPLMLAVKNVLGLFLSDEAWVDTEGVESTITRLMS